MHWRIAWFCLFGKCLEKGTNEEKAWKIEEI
jgi:hypothetical protein